MGSDAEIWIVLTGLCLMVGLLIADRLRPGLVLFSIVVLFMCAGIVSPEEVLAGFGNKGVITVALPLARTFTSSGKRLASKSCDILDMGSASVV